jgi:hypothetical protein
MFTRVSVTGFFVIRSSTSLTFSYWAGVIPYMCLTTLQRFIFLVNLCPSLFTMRDDIQGTEKQTIFHKKKFTSNDTFFFIIFDFLFIKKGMLGDGFWSPKNNFPFTMPSPSYEEAPLFLERVVLPLMYSINLFVSIYLKCK